MVPLSTPICLSLSLMIPPNSRDYLGIGVGSLVEIYLSITRACAPATADLLKSLYGAMLVAPTPPSRNTLNRTPDRSMTQY